jgi:hypothetical protein
MRPKPQRKFGSRCFQNIKRSSKIVIAETQKGYKMFRCFVVGNQQTQWDKIVHKMHTKDPWISVNGSSNKDPHVHSWPSFLDCIELHKLTIFPVDAAEKQHYYMTKTVKKPQRATVCQYMACMGILNNYLSHIPTVFNSPMAIEGTKKGNVPFDNADLAGIVLNSVPVSWMSQYNMMHTTLPNGTRTLLQDLELIKRVMGEKHEAGQKVKAKEASASAIAEGSLKKRSASGNSGERVPKKGKSNKFCQHCRAKGGPHLNHNTKECCRYNGMGNSMAAVACKSGDAKPTSKKRGKKQMAYLTATVESLMKKGLKKAIKSKKCKCNRAMLHPAVVILIPNRKLGAVTQST